MSRSARRTEVLRFDAFEVDLEAGELRKNGIPVPLQDKPFQLLTLLLETAGRVVGREEIRQRLWGPETFVEFDDNLNHAVRKLREALGDSAGDARFIQTLPRRGYRFVATVAGDPPVASSIAKSYSPFSGEGRLLLVGLLTIAVALVWWTKASRRELFPVPIAVLPFVYLDSKGENERLADGITSDIMNELARIPQLRVVARSSAFQYKGRGVDVREIGRSLGVDAIVEGSVRRANGRLLLSTHIVNTSDGFRRWSRSYEPDTAGEVFVPENVARDVARALKVPAPGDGSPSLWRRSRNPEAYELVLKARYLVPTTRETAETKLGYYREAIARDPEYPAPWLGMADTWGRLASMGAVPPRDVMEKAREAIVQALRIDDTIADAQAGIHWSYDWNWAAADREFRRAIELDPSSATIRSFYALYLSQMGRFDEALRQTAAIRALEPLSADSRTMEAAALYLSRQYDRSLVLSKTVLARHPEAAGLYYWLGRSYASTGSMKESLEALEKFLPADEDRGRGFGMLGFIYAQSGRRADALALLARVLDRVGRKYVSPVSIAQIYIGLGDHQSALDWLEKGYRERDAAMSSLRVEPAFDPIRREERFQSLLKKLNFQ